MLILFHCFWTKVTLVVLLVVVLGISSLKMRKAFLMRTHSATKLCMRIRPDIPRRSTVLDF